MKNHELVKSWQYAILALGVSVCLTGALLMVVGEPVLGENHSGVATVVAIIGIGGIGTFNKKLRAVKAESSRRC